MTTCYEVSQGVQVRFAGPDDEELQQNAELSTGGRHALVVGYPWTSAYAVVGTPEELCQFGIHVAELTGADKELSKGISRAKCGLCGFSASAPDGELTDLMDVHRCLPPEPRRWHESVFSIWTCATVAVIAVMAISLFGR